MLFSRRPIPTDPDQGSDSNPNPHIFRSAKPTISCLFFSPFSATTTTGEPSLTTTTKKKGGPAFRGLGCTASAAEQVSVPAVIRSSAEWVDVGGGGVGKKPKKKKKKKKNNNKETDNNNNNNNNYVNFNVNGCIEGGGGGGFNGNCMVIQDVWCGPGIGLSPDAVVGSVDCVVSRRNVVGGRGKVDDGERVVNRERERERERGRERERDRERDRERPPCAARRAAVNPDILSFWDTDPAFISSRPEPEVFAPRYYRHLRYPSPDGFAEMMVLQNRFVMGGVLDRHRDWRLDTDNMTYEQLLELSDRIGYVCTGLKEEEIARCLRKLKYSILNELSSHMPIIIDKKCSICQEEFEEHEELGKLECGHGFHVQCIKHWLSQKNACPFCKTAPVSR